METIISFGFTIVKLIIALSVITVIHEFGHFLMCKLLKIKVNEFAIGFGPKIFQIKGKETVYSLRWILLGGYNAIEGEAEESNDPKAFNKQPAWKRLIILVMGSVFNIILAFVLFMIVSSNFDIASTKINKFVEYEFTQGSPVQRAGLQIGDEIVSINGKKVSVFGDIKEELIKENKALIKYKRNGKIYETEATNLINEIGNIGIILEQDPQTKQNKIRFIEPGKPALEAGLKAGDSITKVNGVEVFTMSEVTTEIFKYANKDVKIEYSRNGENKVGKTIKPVPVKRFNIGFEPEYVEAKGFEKIKYGITYAKETFATVLNSYKQLFTGQAKVTQLSGIVGVGEVVSKTETFIEFLNLIAVVSLSVGLMNLLPIPPMDGGKIFITLIEVITRKKISIKTEAIISYIFLGLLILLTIVVTWNDIIRIF